MVSQRRSVDELSHSLNIYNYIHCRTLLTGKAIATEIRSPKSTGVESIRGTLPFSVRFP